MSADDRLRTRERAVREMSDPVAVRRLLAERARIEDPIAKLRELVARAQDLRRDAGFTLADIVRTVRYAQACARKRHEKGIRVSPKPGTFWVRDRGVEKLVRFTEPEHKPQPRFPASLGEEATCEACGADAQIDGRCVVDVGEPIIRASVEPGVDTEDAGIRRDDLAVVWWRGTGGYTGLRSETLRTSPVGVRHFALILWDGEMGLVAVEVKTAVAHQKVTSVFPMVKTDGHALNASAWLAWALEPDRARVAMSIDYVLGRDRGAPELWKDRSVLEAGR